MNLREIKKDVYELTTRVKRVVVSEPSCDGCAFQGSLQEVCDNCQCYDLVNDWPTNYIFKIVS